MKPECQLTNNYLVKRVSKFTYITTGEDGVLYTLTIHKSSTENDVRLYIPKRCGQRKQIRFTDAPKDIQQAFLECNLTSKFCELAHPKHGIRNRSTHNEFYCRLALAKERITSPGANLSHPIA